MKNVLVTGSKGFIGKNLMQALGEIVGLNVYEFHKGSKPTELVDNLTKADFIFHLAGVNRPIAVEEFHTGNFILTNEITQVLKSKLNGTGVVFASSTQATNDSPYGNSKRQAEDSLMALARGAESTSKVFIYRLPNVFGEGCRPNYNSAVATFCYNLNSNLPIIINDENAKVNLVYVKDVVREFLHLMQSFFLGEPIQSGFRTIAPVQEIRISHVAEMLSSFKRSSSDRLLNSKDGSFESKLANTFNSYKNNLNI